MPKSKKETLLAAGDKVALSVNAKAKYRRALSQLGVSADDEFPHRVGVGRSGCLR